MSEDQEQQQESKTLWLKEDLEKTRKEKEYRPNGIFVIYRKGEDGNKQFLLVEGNHPKVKDQDMWELPQGGIDEDSLLRNIWREPEEELGMRYSQMHNVQVGILPPRSIDYAEPRKNIRNPEVPEKGKRYYSSSIEYVGDPNLEIDKEELNRYKWVTYDEAVEMFERLRELGKDEKVDLMVQALDVVNGGTTTTGPGPVN